MSYINGFCGDTCGVVGCNKNETDCNDLCSSSKENKCEPMFEEVSYVAQCKMETVSGNCVAKSYCDWK